MRSLFVGLVMVASGCTQHGGQVEGPAVAPSRAPIVVVPPASKLTIAQARQYMLALINRDRASMGLGAVELDQGAPTRAGQRHAEDMAHRGYLGHYGTDGSVPEQRMTEAGGADMVLENASCYVDEKSRTLDFEPAIDPRNIERAEAMFFDEQPPHDGHRKNILGAWHTHVGIGVAQPVARPSEIPVPCIAQEFVDVYGKYDSIPRVLSTGAWVRVQGTVSPPAKFAAVGVARAKIPAPLSVAEANRRRTYPVPTPAHVYWPKGAYTAIVVDVTGNQFGVRVPVAEGRQTGLYEVSVWAHMPDEKDPVMVGLRTVVVR